VIINAKYLHVAFGDPPPPEVTILEGEGNSVFCNHKIGAVEWYKGDTQIEGNKQQEICGCVETFTVGVDGRNLVFSNFTAAESSGVYSCRVTFNNNSGFACSFNVISGIHNSYSTMHGCC
jgi:hypothetical protein